MKPQLPIRIRNQSQHTALLIQTVFLMEVRNITGFLITFQSKLPFQNIMLQIPINLPPFFTEHYIIIGILFFTV